VAENGFLTFVIVLKSFYPITFFGRLFDNFFNGPYTAPNLEFMTPYKIFEKIIFLLNFVLFANFKAQIR
jgi:hypothetical protein